MQEDLISKKELLKLTGISYGQLYRWKRQKLIPEAWFLKQSSFTGQETFFPREKILARVRQIMELKDRYSLEELADVFAPESTGRLYQERELASVPELDPAVITIFQRLLQKDRFNFPELLFVYILSKLQSHGALSETDLADMASSIRNWLPKLKNISYRFIVCSRQSQTFSLLLQQDAPLFLDHKISELHVYELDELAKDLSLKLNQAWEGDL